MLNSDHEFPLNGKRCISLSQFRLSLHFSLSLLLLSFSFLMSTLDAILTTFSYEQCSCKYSFVFTSLGTRHTALLGCTCQLGSLPCWLRKFSKMVGHTIQVLSGRAFHVCYVNFREWLDIPFKHYQGRIPCSLQLSQMVGCTIQGGWHSVIVM